MPQSFLDRLVTAGVVSSAVGLVGTPEVVERQGVAGQARERVPARLATRFDYASLTKPVTATLALALDAEGALPLSTRLGDVWAGADRKLARRSLAALLRHRSGLAAWTPLYHRCRSLDEVDELLLAGGQGGDLIGARAGTYSDLGYILWGRTAERAMGQPLRSLLQTRVLTPLRLASVEPSPGERPDLAESWMGTGEEVRLAAKQGLAVEDLGPPPLGLPQDGNGRFLVGLGAGGGVCGHAGLFGGAQDVWRLGAEWLAPGRVLEPEGVAAALAGGGPFALGWWRRTLRGSAGRALSPTAFGHTGFAGNSLWIDPERRRIFVLLAARRGPETDMNRWRRRFHREAVAPARPPRKREASADGTP